MKPAIVDSTQCHLWTDALHARQLAREALNKWDRGTYVRMCIMTVWTALETSYQDILDDVKIGYSFKSDVDQAVARKLLPRLDWSQGVFQDVRTLQELRKSYVHRFLSLSDMFPAADIANNAINTVRDAIKALCQHANKPLPNWLAIDDSKGWQNRSSYLLSTLVTGHEGVTLDDPNAVRIFTVIDGHETLTTVLPSGVDPGKYIDELLQNIRIPINGVRVYDSGILIRDLFVNMRGNV
jgi:hypothetical protein